jgi:hypothetical protein
MQSHTRGPKGTVVQKTMGEAFLETANRFAERVALISRHQNIRLTWAEYAHQAQRIVAGPPVVPYYRHLLSELVFLRPHRLRAQDKGTQPHVPVEFPTGSRENESASERISLLTNASSELEPSGLLAVARLLM